MRAGAAVASLVPVQGEVEGPVFQVREGQDVADREPRTWLGVTYDVDSRTESSTGTRSNWELTRAAASPRLSVGLTFFKRPSRMAAGTARVAGR